MSKRPGHFKSPAEAVNHGLPPKREHTVVRQLREKVREQRQQIADHEERLDLLEEAVINLVEQLTAAGVIASDDDDNEEDEQTSEDAPVEATRADGTTATGSKKKSPKKKGS